MADGHGGYRRPEHPAAVSGPGALSARTDGGATSQPPMVAPGGAYGERKDMEQIQGGAPMAAAAQLPAINAPTANPGEPITAGAEVGAGIGPQAAGIKDDYEVSNEQLRPMIRSLELLANLPGSNRETRQWVRAIKARLAE